jgi:DNA mismatch repair protein MutS2
MDQKTIRALEFDKVLRMASSFALTGPGSEAVRCIRPIQEPVDIISTSEAVSECRKVLSGGESSGIEWFDDLTTLFKKVRPEDSVLDPLELRAFLPLFHSSQSLARFGKDVSLRRLSSLTASLQSHPDIGHSIERSIAPDGYVADEASVELADIRRRIRTIETRMNRTLEGILARRDLKPHLQDHFITQRNNRWVIPVKRDSKGSVPGIVHDISNTGETLFIEPYEVQMLGNELESMRAEEKLEIYRILRRLTALLRDSMASIENDYAIVIELDRLFCIASFAEAMQMTQPVINERLLLRIIGGRHPLLWDILKRQGREEELVPLDFELGADADCMVITGSNAGGKTVTLKTAGVIVLMALSGMHVPAKPGTAIPFLTRVLADIGDDQSIEQNLSTFSAHIKRLNEIIGLSGHGTLAIIDELGTGTDPEQGGALACATLRTLRQKGAIAVVSTHLGMLKAFAHSEDRMINGSMEMEEIRDNGTRYYRPTYRLVIGAPGTSHALEIAGSLGLDPAVIEQAREFLQERDTGVDALIAELGRRTKELRDRIDDMRKQEEEVRRLKEKLRQELKHMEQKKKEAIAGALREAEQIVLDARGRMNRLIDQAKRGEARARRKALEEAAMEVRKIRKMREAVQPEDLEKIEDVSEGQRVYIRILDKEGVVRSVDRKSGRCRVVVDGREVLVPVDSLFEPVSDGKAISKRPSDDTSRKRPDLPEREVSDEINVVGQRVDPAVSIIERFLNDAAMANLGEVKIIHGVGTGRLAAAIREYLSGHPLCECWRVGAEEEGGAGVTVVTLNA